MSDNQSSIVWSLSGNLSAKITRMDPVNFLSLLNTAIHCSFEDTLFLISQIKNDGTIDIDFKTEADWAFSRSKNDNGAPFVISLSEGSRQSFPLKLRHADTYISNRVALIGYCFSNLSDACHTVNPLAGQGLNLGVSDAECLARVLSESIRDGQDIGHHHTLEKYFSERYLLNSSVLVGCDLMSRIFSTDDKALSFIRSLGFNFVDNSEYLKTQLMNIFK